MKFTPIDNIALGMRRTAGFVMRAGHCGPESWDEPVYGEDAMRRGRELREARCPVGADGRRLIVRHNLREAAQMLGLRPSELSSLELGKTRLPDDQHAEALRLLAGDADGKP